MNNGYDYNGQNNDQSNENNQKEEIRFDEWEPRNPYSGGYSSDVNYGAYNGWTEPPVLIDEAEHKSNFSRIGFGFALFTLISTVAALLIQIITQNIAPEFCETSLFLNLVSPVALYIFALPALLILLSGVEAKAPEKKPLGIGRWFLFLLVGFGVMYIGAIIGNTVMDYFSELMGYDYSNALEDIVDENHIWITAIFTVIVAPIGEEFVFRKLLMDRTQKYGGAVSVLISAIVFGLMHGNFYQFFYCLGLGLILAYIYHSTGRLLPCILLHASINLVGSVVPTLLSPVLDAIESIDLENVDATAQFLAANVGGILAALAFSLFVYAAMAAAVIIPIVMRKKIKLSAPEVAIPRKRAIAIIVANAGAIVLLALYALEFGLSLIPA